MTDVDEADVAAVRWPAAGPDLELPVPTAELPLVVRRSARPTPSG